MRGTIADPAAVDFIAGMPGNGFDPRQDDGFSPASGRTKTKAFRWPEG
jgi:hypothetical protein